MLAPVVLAPLLGGTAERPYTVIVAALGALAGLVAAVVAGRRGEPLRFSLFAVVLAVATVASLLQLVPLPPGLRAALAPGSEAALRWPGAGPADAALLPPATTTLHLPLSVDPAATANEVVRLLGSLCLLGALGTLLQRRGDSRRLGRVVVGTAALVAALGALAALGVPLPQLVAVPAGGATRALLPAALYNSNHMAALLAVGAIVTVGALGEPAGRGERVLQVFALGLLDVALLGTLSRAGILIGVMGQLVVLAWGRRTRERAPAPRRRGLWLVGLPLLVAGGLLLAHPAWLGSLAARFAAVERAALLAPGSKVRAWLDALPLLRGHLLFGVGRGGFDAAFAGYQPLAEATRFVYLENQALQTLCDWGVPVALLLFALLALALRDAARELRPVSGRPRSRVRLAAGVAFVGLLLHNTVDFNLEVGGVAAAALLLVALIERPRYALSPRWGVALSVATLAGAALVLVRCPSAEEDGARLRALALAAPAAASPAQLTAAARAAVHRHPLDSYLYATVAAGLQAEHEAAALPWASRALAINPRDLGARRTVALLLAEAGHRGQALRTLALAIADGDRLQRQWLLATALRIAQTPAELLAVLPEPGDALPAGLSPGRIADELLELLGAQPAPPWPLLRAVAAWGRSQGAGEALSWLGRACLAERDADGAAALLEPLIAARAPPLLLGDLLMLLIDTNHLEEADRLAPAALLHGRPAEVLLAAALLQERHGDLGEARRLLDSALSAAADRPQLRARVHEVRADLEARAGNPHRADLERAAAAQLRP